MLSSNHLNNHPTVLTTNITAHHNIHICKSWSLGNSKNLKSLHKDQQ